jgi:vacuolar-type H+-ATPase subunit I/STV1
MFRKNCIMPEPTLYRHPLKVARQLEMSSDSSVGESALAGDYERQIHDSQRRLKQLQAEQEELERLAAELEELNAKKKVFFSSQAEIMEKLGNAVTLIDRELLAMRTELHELEQCRHVFESRLNKIGGYDPEAWTQENVKIHLERAIATIDDASDEYEEAAAHFANMRSGQIFQTGKRRRSSASTSENSEFFTQLKNGFAFNLPIMTLAVVGLIFYLLR